MRIFFDILLFMLGRGLVLFSERGITIVVFKGFLDLDPEVILLQEQKVEDRQDSLFPFL